MSASGGDGVQIYNSSGTSGRIDLGKTFSGNVFGLATYHNGSNVGGITYNNTSTAYNTSSDYRLKENVTDVTDGITRVKQLEPKRFNFIADPDTTVDGFLAMKHRHSYQRQSQVLTMRLTMMAMRSCRGLTKANLCHCSRLH